MISNKVLRCTTGFMMAVGLSACSSVPEIESRMLGENITQGCHKNQVFADFNKETGEQVGRQTNKLSDKPVYGCQEFQSQLLLVQNPGYTLEDRAFNAAALLMTWSTGTQDGQRSLKQALQLTGMKPDTLLRVVVLDALDMASSQDPENQHEGLSRLLSIHRNDLFPKFEKRGPEIVEEELENKGLNMADVEEDLLKGTRMVYDHIWGQKEPDSVCFENKSSGAWVCNF